MSTEEITVWELGEDSDAWLVTGTTDAHSADEAVRNWFESTAGETIEAFLDADDLVEFTIRFRDDWAWKPMYSGAPSEEAFLIHGADANGWPQFSGFLVQAS